MGLIEELKCQFAESQMVPRNAIAFDFYFEQGRDEFCEADLELMVGRVLNHAAVHVSADEVKQVGKGFIADEEGACPSKQVNHEGEILSDGLLQETAFLALVRGTLLHLAALQEIVFGAISYHSFALLCFFALALSHSFLLILFFLLAWSWIVFLCFFSLQPLLAFPHHHPSLLLGLPLPVSSCIFELILVKEKGFCEPKGDMQ